ncbi:MAG: hypothetical protein L6Q76_23200, partial [Polyangiaceae bacterium]|nr:hypothetical protein [Polyangiaceae bacterium]
MTYRAAFGHAFERCLFSPSWRGPRQCPSGRPRQYNRIRSSRRLIGGLSGDAGAGKLDGLEDRVGGIVGSAD